MLLLKTKRNAVNAPSYYRACVLLGGWTNEDTQFVLGYGGLDMAVEQHFSAKTAYWSDVDKTACAVMAARFPNAQPTGDLTTLDLTMIHADVLTAGYPCQPFSNAGNRLGEKDERHLWPYIRNTISVLRPQYVVLENVAAHLSLGAASVVGDLAGLGYDAQWTVIRASDVGAPHKRQRWFCLAANTDYPGAREKQNERTPCRKPAPFGDDSSRFGVDRRREGIFGTYGPAIEQWEVVTGRLAPPFLKDDLLNSRCVEFLMGLEEGHVTDIAASRAKALACLGNGVVPQQAKRALELLT